jgi:GNAT superfamily N-acetyltransferase
MEPMLPDALLYADAELARRLEGLTAREMWRMARAAHSVFPEREALAIEIAGGVAAFVGEGSAINEAFGLGLAGEVTEEDVALLERFYEWRGARGKVGVCPFAHPSLVRTLGERGWVPEDFEHVLARPLPSDEEFPDTEIDVRVCADGERDLWARVVAVSFAAPALPTRPELDLAHIVAAREEALLYLAWIDGEAVGAGELVIDEGVAWLSADTTLPPYRGRGVQLAVQIERLRAARAAGCDLAVTESEPGSGSQRNMERLGFRVVYTRVDMVAPWRAHSADTTADDGRPSATPDEEVGN